MGCVASLICTHWASNRRWVEVDIGDKIVKCVKEDYYLFQILDFRFQLWRPILLIGSFPNFNGLWMQNVNLYFLHWNDLNIYRNPYVNDVFPHLVFWFMPLRTETKCFFPNSFTCMILEIKSFFVSFQPKFEKPYFLHEWPKFLLFVNWLWLFNIFCEQ